MGSYRWSGTVPILQDEKRSGGGWWWWLHNDMNILNTTETYTLKNDYYGKFNIVCTLPQFFLKNAMPLALLGYLFSGKQAMWQGTEASCQEPAPTCQPHEKDTLEANSPALVAFTDNCSLSQHLDCDLKRSRVRPIQLSHSWISVPQKLCKIKSLLF